MKLSSVIPGTSLLILILYSSIAYPQSKDNRIFDSSALKISEISTNSIHSDFGPSVVQDTLYFTSYNDKLFNKTDIKLKKKEFFDLYKARIDNQGNVIGKRQAIDEFTSRYNDGPVAWCQKTGELFVTQNYDDQTAKLRPFQKEFNRLKIIIANRINGRWEKVLDFPYNSTEYSVGHPAITASGDTLVFSSDKPGGFGKTDLYYSIRKDGKWENPVNLGPKINSAEKEEFPFITDQHLNGQFLIYSSEVGSGNGGFDLYYTRFPSDYSEIVHFDSPINGQSDDFAMTISTDAEYGYLTSNRPGTGSDDIYKFNFKRIKLQKRFRELYAFDNGNRHPIPGVRIVACDQQTYLTDASGKVSSIPCNENDCEVSASKIGYSEKSKALLACKMDNNVITRDTIWMDLITNKKIILHNIYYDFDKWDILPESAIELDQLVLLLKENPEMKVELSAHTDSRGTEKYNLKLSQLRAKAAIDFVISKGIDNKRITGVGYGKSQLINKCNENCTPTQHRENRRTELYIPGFLRGEPVKQEKGDYSSKKPASGYSPYREDHVSIDSKNVNGMKFYLILGSFKDRELANKLVSQLRSESFDATILGDAEFFRVAIRYDNLGQTKKALEGLKDKYPDCWITQGK